MWNDDERAPEENRTLPQFGGTPASTGTGPAGGATQPAEGDEAPTRRAEPGGGTRLAVSGWGTEEAGGVSASGASDARGAGPTNVAANPSLLPTVVAAGTVLLDKYRVERKLGEGGMGSVWLVRHLRLDEPRALKVIGEGIANDRQARARFDLEARILAKLKHPNAVTVHDTGIVGDTAYIEMEFVQGESLRQRLRRDEPLTPGVILWILRGVCDVLGFAHGKGIVHRDLKPENVMIVTDPETGRRGVKVVDFGIAKIVQAGDAQSMTMHTQGLLGTPAYSSPEQNALDVDTNTRAPVDHRSDIYSLGVMLYEMLTGKLPFQGKWAQVLYQHANVAPRPLREVAPEAGISEAVENLVLRCLDKSPERRPASAAELYNAFREAIGDAAAVGAGPAGDGTQTTPWDAPLTFHTPRAPIAAVVTPTPEVRPRPRRRLAAVLGALAVAVAAVVAVAAGWLDVSRFRVEDSRSDRAEAESGAGAESSSAALGASPTVPPSVSKPVADYLRTYLPRRPHQAEEGAELVKLDDRWWPRTIAAVGAGDRRRLELRGRVYLPTAASPEPSEGTEGPYKLPLAVAVGEGPARIVYRLIAGGSFGMGEPDPKRQTADDKPYHKVVLSPYYLQETETTVAQFEPFRREADRGMDEDFRSYDEEASSRVRQGEDSYPAVFLPRRACAAFAARFGAQLPTEAQWEFAARSRGERRSPHVWSDVDAVPSEMANVDDVRLDPRLMAVKSFNSDRTMQGIFDMAGNAREWCRDVHRAYLDASVAAVDPFEAPREGESDPFYSIRGGSYLTPRETARVSFRSDLPDLEYKAKDRDSLEDVGFRTVLEIVVAPRLDDGGRPVDASSSEDSP